jgi:hypothetical protein
METLGRAFPRLGGLDGAIARRSIGDESAQQLVRSPRDLLDRAIERCLIGLRRSIETAQLAHELQGGRMDLLVRRGRLEIMKRPDVSAHGGLRASGSIASEHAQYEGDFLVSPFKSQQSELHWAPSSDERGFALRRTG